MNKRGITGLIAIILAIVMVLTTIKITTFADPDAEQQKAAQEEVVVDDIFEEPTDEAPAAEAPAAEPVITETPAAETPAAEPVTTEEPAAEIPAVEPVTNEAPAAVNKEEKAADETVKPQDTAKEKTPAVAETQKSEEKADKEDKAKTDNNIEEKYPAMTLTAMAGDVKVILTAPEGCFPEGTSLNARKVGQQYIDAVAEQLEAQGRELVDAVAIDVTPVDKNGKEIQPKKNVSVTFSGTGLDNESGDSVDVYYVSDNTSTVEAMPTSTATSDRQTFTTDHFTIYVAVKDDGSPGSASDPNGDGSGANSLSNPYVLEPNTTITLNATTDSNTWDIDPTNSYVTLSNKQNRSVRVRNNITSGTTDREVRIRHHRSTTSSREYYYLLVKAPTHDVEFLVREPGDTVFNTKDTVNVAYNQAATEPDVEDPKTVDGAEYTFDGWYTDSNCNTKADLSNITENMVVYGKYDLAGYKVTYRVQDAGESQFSILEEEIVAPGDSSTPPEPAEQTVDGKTYEFKGWYPAEACEEGTEVSDDAFQNINESKTFYGKYELVKYTVSYKHKAPGAGGFADDDPASEEVDSGSAPANVPSHHDKYTDRDTGRVYDFDGWYTDEACTKAIDLTRPVEEDITVYSRYVAEVRLTFDGNKPDGATELTPVPAPVYDKTGLTFTLPSNAPEYEGYHLVGWTTNEDGSGDSYAPGATFTMPDQDITLYAQWREGTVTVTYNRNHSDDSEDPVLKTETAPEHNNHYVIWNSIPRRAGYLFAGWSTDSSDKDPEVIAGDHYKLEGDDVTFYAVWAASHEEMLLTKELTAFGGEIYYDGQEHKMFKEITGYEDGVSGISGVKETDNPRSGGDYKYGKYVRVGRYTVGDHHHNLYAYVGSNDFRKTGKDVGEYTVPSEANLYTHNNDSGDMEQVNESDGTHDGIVVKNNVLTIKKLPIKIRTASDEVAYGDPRPQLTAGGWIQVGDGNEIQFTATGKDVTLVTGETVNIRTTGSISTTTEGSVTNTYEIAWGDVEKTNYEISEELGTLTVYRNKVNFDGNDDGDDTLDHMPYPATDIGVSGNSYTIPNDKPTREHYEFTEWNTKDDGSGTPYRERDTYTFRGEKVVTFYAQWTPKKYTITYDPNGGKFRNSTEPTGINYDYAENIEIAEEATDKTHYEFKEWNTKADGSGDSYDQGDEYTVEGNATLYAQWTPVEYTITYTDGVEGEEVFADVEKKADYGTATPAFGDTDPEREHYTFAGWTPAVKDTVEGDQTYTATWTPVEYTITYTDGVEGEEVFADVEKKADYGTATPTFGDSDPERFHYTFDGWTPEIKDTVDGDATYTATWTRIEHQWDEGEITTPPTCTEKGVKTYHCTIPDCGETKTEEIPALGHDPADPVKENVVDATCTKDGSYDEVVYCNRCEEELSRETKTTPALGHDWGAWEVTKEPTTTEEGEEARTCARCGEVETRPIPKIDPENIEYRNTEGDGNIWVKGSGVTCDFTFKRSADDETTHDHFTGILVDGKPVDEANYTSEPGSVIIKLKPKYLETLALGDHTLTAIFDDGNDPTVKFKIIEKKDDKKDDQKKSNKAPKTGDDNNAILWLVTIIAAIALMFSTFTLRRIRQK